MVELSWGSVRVSISVPVNCSVAPGSIDSLSASYHWSRYSPGSRVGVSVPFVSPICHLPGLMVAPSRYIMS